MLNEEPVVAVGNDDSQEFMSCFFAQARHVLFGVRAARPDLERLTDLDQPNALLLDGVYYLGLQERIRQKVALSRLIASLRGAEDQERLGMHRLDILPVVRKMGAEDAGRGLGILDETQRVDGQAALFRQRPNGQMAQSQYYQL
jgi:hypothetical protein